MPCELISIPFENPSISVEFLAKNMMIGYSTDFRSYSLVVLANNSALLESELILQQQKILPYIFTILGACLTFLVLIKNFSCIYINI